MKNTEYGKFFKKFFSAGEWRNGAVDGRDVEARMVCACVRVYVCLRLEN